MVQKIVENFKSMHRMQNATIRYRHDRKRGEHNVVTRWIDGSEVTRWIKEAIHIRKEGQQAIMNRDEGSYTNWATHMIRPLSWHRDTASSRCVKNRKNWVPASSDEGLW